MLSTIGFLLWSAFLVILGMVIGHAILVSNQHKIDDQQTKFRRLNITERERRMKVR